MERLSQNSAIFALVFHGRGRHRRRVGRLPAAAAAAAVARCGRRRREHRQRRRTDHVVLVGGGCGVGRLGGDGSHGGGPAAASGAVVQRPANAVPERPTGRGFFPEAGELGAVPVER